MSNYHKIETIEELNRFLTAYPESSLLVQTDKGHRKNFKCSVIANWYNPIKALQRGIWISDADESFAFQVNNGILESNEKEVETEAAPFDFSNIQADEPYDYSELNMESNRSLAIAGWSGALAILFALCWVAFTFIYDNEDYSRYSMFAMVPCTIFSIFFLFRSHLEK